MEPTHFPIQWLPMNLSPGVKRPGRAFDHSLPPSSIVACTVTTLTGLPDYEVI
jgi:hypothetical protein